MSNQATRVRATDSRGRPVRGVYRRGEQFIAGFRHNGRWQTRLLKATTLTDARRERESLLAALREQRRAETSAFTFRDLFTDSQAVRSISDRTRAHEVHLMNRPSPRSSTGAFSV